MKEARMSSGGRGMEIMAIIWLSDGGNEMNAKGKQSFQPTFFRMFLGPI